MKDHLGREIDYMRISVTDRCNLRCRYCMPEEGIRLFPVSEVLTYEEIERVCRISAGLGIRKIRLTGGEPLARAHLAKLVRMIRRIPEIQLITMTTNGILLKERLPELLDAGLDGVNISLDTLNEELYEKITGFPLLSRAMEGMYAALDAGIRVKVNTVLLPGNFFPGYTSDWKEMLSLARELPVDLRFIELMPIGEAGRFEQVNGEQVKQELGRMYPDLQQDRTIHGNGPAVYCRIPGFAGTVGMILAVHEKFCQDCNRIRLSATGKIKPCLCYADTTDLRRMLRDGTSDGQIRKVLEQAVWRKPAAHCFDHPREISEKHRMFSIGG